MLTYIKTGFILTKNTLQTLFNRFNDLNVLIIGDVMIDAYYFGHVNRVSPEAPVPIVQVEKRENRLGGAANVVLNVQALGATPILCTVVGNEAEAETFDTLLKEKGLATEGVINSNDRITTVKTRIIGNNHQVLRVDSETEEDLSNTDNDALVEKITQLIDKQKIDVIIFEDYDKGVISKSLIEKVVEVGSAKGIPIAADPKRKNFDHYKNISLFKPNLKELQEGLNKTDISEIEQVQDAVVELNKKLGNIVTFITLSEKGVLINEKNDFHHINAHLRNIADVSGAGDTVISVASLCLALKIPIQEIAALANLAGGLVCEKVGVVPIDKKQFLEEASEKIASL